MTGGIAARLERRLARPSIDARGTALLFALLGFVAAIAAARPGLLSGPWLWNPDMPKIDYPLASFAHDALSAGRLPLWNDQMGLGFPLYAEGQVGAFYPPNWLIFQLPPLAALDVTRILHLTLAGTGAGLLAMRYARVRTASAIAVVVAVLGGAIVSKLEWYNMVAAYGWMPWVLLPLAGRGLPSRRNAVAAGILWGVQALCGHPNTWLLTGIAAVLLLVAAAPRPRVLARIVPFGLVGGAVGAVQLLPTAILTTLSVRSSSMTPADLFASAATPFDLLGTAFSNAFAVPTAHGWWDIYKIWYPDSTFALLEAASYVGIPVLVLAAVALSLRRSRPMALLVAAALVLPIVAAFQPSWWTAVPLLNVLRSPVRSYMVASLAIGILAAVGAARLGLGRASEGGAAVGASGRSGGEAATRRSLPDPLGLAVLAFGAVAMVWVIVEWMLSSAPDVFNAVYMFSSSFVDPKTLPDLRRTAIEALGQPWPRLGEVAIGGAALIAVAVARRRGGPRRVTRLALLSLGALPLFAFGTAPNSTATLPAFDSSSTAFVQEARAADAHRLLTLGEPGWYEGMPDQLAAAGVADIRMFSSLNLAVVESLVTDLRSGAAGDDVRRALGIDTVVTFNGAACPGQTIATVPATKAVFCRDSEALEPPYWIPASLVTAAPGGSHLVPTTPTDWTIDTSRLGSVAVARSAVTSLPGQIEATVAAPAAGWVWIDRAWWPDWQVTVDGASVSAARALGGLLVPVGAGTHSITARLIPLDALAGLAAGLVVLGLALVWMQQERPGTRRERPGTRRERPRGTARPMGAPPKAMPESAPEPKATARISFAPLTPARIIAATTIVALAAFLWRLTPGVAFWDTGAYQAAAATGGLVHPTGYPTFLILGFIWVHLLPFLDPATALNMVTAVAGALAVGAIAACAVRLGARPWLAATGALAVGLTTEFWATSARADPHPLHVLLALAIVLVLLRWDRRATAGALGADRWLAGAALLFGVAMANHGLTAMLAPGVGVYVVTARPQVLRRPRAVAQAVIALAAGLAVYAYIPIRAAANPPVHHDYAPTTLALFWRYVTGADFASNMGFLSASGPGTALGNLPVLLGHLGDWLTPPGALVAMALAGCGAVLLARRRQFRVLWLLLATGGLTLYARLTYANGDIERYALYPMAVAGVLAAIGATALADGAERAVAGAAAGVGRAVRALPVVLAIAVPAVLLPMNSPRATSPSAACYVDAVEAQAPQGAWLVAWWSLMTPLWYAQAVQGRRQDLGLVLAGSEAVHEVDKRWGDGRPIWLVENEQDVGAVLDAGYTLEEVKVCGWGAWSVTGRASPSSVGAENRNAPAADHRGATSCLAWADRPPAVSPWARRRS